MPLLPSSATWFCRAAVLAALAACAHSGDRLSAADRHARQRELGSAIRLYREVAAEECVGGSARLCCQALAGEAESLLASGERQAALQAFGRSREQCPDDLTIRRRQYLADHALDDEPTETPRSVSFSIEYALQGLGDDVRVAWAGVFLDGELVGRDPVDAIPGPHELEAEVFFEATAGAQRGRRQRLRDRKPVNIVRGSSSPRVAVRVALANGAGGNQLVLTLPDPDAETATPAPETGLAPAVLSQHVGFSLRETGEAPRVPPALMRRGDGWRMPLEVCVAATGRVDRLRFVAAAPGREPLVDAAVVEAIRRWRYGAFKVGTTAHGFCHPLDFDLARP